MTAGAAALAAMSRVARAQSYPTRPVHWIVSFTAGGPNDIVARIIGQYLSERLGQQFIIEKKGGAGGKIGLGAGANAPPRGLTLRVLPPHKAPQTAPSSKPPLRFVFRRVAGGG